MKNIIEELTNQIIDFRDKREWKQFHNAKDLAISLNIEAAELLECFQWKSLDEVKELINSEEVIKVQEEIADVAIYLMLLCNELNIDLEDAIIDKLDKNDKKYPVSKSKGNAQKYDQL